VVHKYDLCRTAGGQLVTVIQSDLLDAMRTRVLVPLSPVGMAGRAIRNLNPVIAYGSDDLVLMPQLVVPRRWRDRESRRAPSRTRTTRSPGRLIRS
jgi:hypothetical protein